MTTKCAMEQAAERLADQVTMREPIPHDFAVDDSSYWEIVASIRHQYTNYDDLLQELPDCWDLMESGECPRAADFADDTELLRECSEVRGHDWLKWVARDVARTAYDAWYQKQKPR